MLKIKLSKYLSKSKLLFYIQLIIFSTIPFLSIRYFRIKIINTDIPIFFIFTLFCVVLYLLTIRFHKELRLDKQTFLFIIIMFIFVFYQFVNGLRDNLLNYAIDEIIKSLSALIVFIFVFFTLKNANNLRYNYLNYLFQPAIIISTIIISVLLVRYYFQFHSKYLGITYEYRTETGKNQLALYIGVFLPVVYNNFKHNKSIINAFYLLIHVLALFYVDSKAVFVSLILSYFVLFLFTGKLSFIKNFFYLSFFIFTIGLFFYLSYNYSIIFHEFNSLNTLINFKTLHSTEMRYFLSIKALLYFIDKPIFGIGTNSFLAHVGTYTHNSYLQLLCEQGIFGFILFLTLIYLIIKTIKKLLKVEKWIDKSFIVSSLVPIFHLLFINAYNLILIYIFWAILFYFNSNHINYEPHK